MKKTIAFKVWFTYIGKPAGIYKNKFRIARVDKQRGIITLELDKKKTSTRTA